MNLTSKCMLHAIAGCALICASTANANSRTITWVEDSFEAPDGAENQAIGQYKRVISGEQSQITNYVWVAQDGDASKLVATNVDYSGGVHPITNATTALVLNLETEGQTLTRNLATNNFMNTPVYVDTLIKFTPSEDNPAISDAAIKAAVFVNAISNLVVYHGVADGNPTNTDVAFKIDPTQWYRLTILMGKFNNGVTPGFKIYVNGMGITNSAAYLDNGSEIGDWFISASQDPTLSAVAFQGTGMVDELSVSDLAIGFGVTPAAILLTLDFNDALVTVTQDGTPVAKNGTVASGQQIVIDAADWYQISSISTNDTVSFTGTIGVNCTTGTVTAAASSTLTINAALYTAANGTISTGAGNLPADKLAAWATSKAGSISQATLASTTAWYDDYLFNVAPATDAKLVISSVNVVGDNIVVVVTTDKPGVVTDLSAVNGTLNYYTVDNLGDTFMLKTSVSATGTGASKTFTIPNTDGKFVKITLQ